MEADVKRIMLTVAYDGTNYRGWQLQPNGITIEEVLNDTLSALLKEEIKVIGASRTDTGVHSLGSIAVFDTASRMPAERLPYALNQRLPRDIRIQGATEVAPDFHPRRCDSRKTYEYRILNREFPLPTQRLYAYFTYVPLDVPRMQAAAGYLVGRHDFKSFCSADSSAQTTVRTVYDLQVSCQEELIVIRITGDGFLYNMVRIIAGTLMEAGRGRIRPEEVAGILNARDRAKAGPTAPACGLTLVKYEFIRDTT